MLDFTNMVDKHTWLNQQLGQKFKHRHTTPELKVPKSASGSLGGKLEDLAGSPPRRTQVTVITSKSRSPPAVPG